MRLTTDEIAQIKDAVAEILGPGATVRLFGSRLDDARKGGDIDLMIEVAPGESCFRNEIRLAAALERRLGERKVDILLHPRGAPPAPIAQIALRDGVLL